MVHNEMSVAFWMSLTVQGLHTKLWYLILGFNSKASLQIKPSILIQREHVCVFLDQALVFPFPLII